MDLETAKYHIRSALKDNGLSACEITQEVFNSLCKALNIDGQDVDVLYYSITTEEVSELARNDFSTFVRLAWSWIETAELCWGPHMDAMCLHLQAIAEGQIKRLVVNVPPRCSKSLISSVMFPAWVWLRRPECKFMCASLKMELANEFSRKCRDLVRHPEYKRLMTDAFDLRDDDQGVTKFANTKGGARESVSVGSDIIGKGFDIAIVDDPLDSSSVTSDAALEKALKFFTGSLPTRMNHQSKGAIVLVMQRIHERDPAGWAIRKGWPALVLPMRFEPEHKCKTKIGFEDWRTVRGELLEPIRFSEEAIQALQDSISSVCGSSAVYAQLQQRPTSAEGNIFKRTWFGDRQRYRVFNKPFDEVCISVDLSFGAQDNGRSYSVLQVWGRSGAQYYLLDQMRDRWEFPEMLLRFVQLCKRWPMARAKYVEAKALGPALISTLHEHIEGILPVQPHGKKEVRALAVVPLFEAGNVFIPHDDLYPWVKDYVEELCSFPKADNDDQVDTTTQALNEMSMRARGSTAWTKEQLNNAMALWV